MADKSLLDKAWEKTQTKTFTSWVNSHLRKLGSSIENIGTDFADGIKLAQLLEVISNDPVFKINKNPKLRIHNIQNIGLCLKHIEAHGVKLAGIGAEELVDQNLKMTLGMIWTIILRFAIQDISLEELSAKEALLLWVQRCTTPAPFNLKVSNFHTSFQDGLAFCALIAKHRPDLINYESLNKEDKAGNLQLAFDIAERELDIPKMLDVSDMLDVPKPDERSVMTYVAQYYHHFASSRKAESAGKQVSKVLDFIMSIEQTKTDYINRATNLVQWIESTSNRLGARDFGDSVESVQQHMAAYKTYKSTEKPPRGQELLELETIFNSLQTKLKLNHREPFVPPQGLLPVDIDSRWSKLEKDEQEHNEALRKELKRQKQIAYLLQKYNRIIKKLESWIASKSAYLTSTELGDSITAVQAKLKNLEAFEGEYQSLQQQSNADLTSILQQLEALAYSETAALSAKKDNFFANEWAQTQTTADTYKNSLLEELAKLQKIEDMLVEFAKRAAQLNVWIESADDTVSDPLNADSVEVVNEIQANFDLFLQEQSQQYAELEALANLTQELRNLGRAENSYSIISYEDVSNKWNALLASIEERKGLLANELQVQTNNDALCQSFAENAQKVNEFCTQQTSVLSENNSSSAEEQLKVVESVLAAASQNESLLNDCVQLSHQLDEAQITDNRYTQLTIESLKMKWEKFITLANKSEQVIQGEILSKSHTGVTAEELAEFRACYNHFDKDHNNSLNRLELSSCLKALGEELTDAQLDAVIAQIADQNGDVAFEPFVDYLSKSRKGSDTADSTKEAFKTMADGKDFITEAQIRAAIPDAQKVEYLLANLPKTAEGYDYNTFVERQENEIVINTESIYRNSRKAGSTKKKEPFKSHPVIVVLTSNKPKHLDRLLATLVSINELDRDRVLVFNDGLQPIDSILEKYDIQNIQQNKSTTNKNKKNKKLYDSKPLRKPNITEHEVASSDIDKYRYSNRLYREVMSVVFEKYPAAIFLEDDLIPSMDFIYYFTKMEPLLWQDSNLFCVSSWNDNAFRWAAYPVQNYMEQRTHAVQKSCIPRNMYSVNRQSHFGGLGWMISNRTYHEKIAPTWGDLETPWDVFVQNSMEMKDYCLYPEIPRVQHSTNASKQLSDIYNGVEDDGWSYMQLSLPKVTWDEYCEHEFDYLVANDYDNLVADMLNKSIKIESIDLLPFFDQFSTASDPKLVYSIVVDDVAFDNDPAWEKHLNPLALVGRGNGGNVRGIYKGVLSFIIHGWRLVFVGRYSKFYANIESLETIRESDTLSEKLEYDISIRTARSKANIFKVSNDKLLVQLLSLTNQNCRDGCAKNRKGVELFCHEADQLLLLDKQATLYLFEKSCDKVEVVKSDYAPLRHDNYTCVIPTDPSHLSCTHPPEPDTMKICICRRIIDKDRYKYHI
ncbi:alpha actinin [Heterostelium album PN500]|uniref:Alpha actinin n=1 Tax=Heterostelium pallidum (strain ATCC 26659 / Pp 5 / PN500) TaxID=670386 RepID=D3B7E5_HETP5|nr:alpha actinin [Heterostelium album PN500]EFA82688.1 alpha actinin [Heterostelium album PN500]|eukprot:XP_020434805.1 alpha actinin [Heterostelium album PN500]